MKSKKNIDILEKEKKRGFDDFDFIFFDDYSYLDLIDGDIDDEESCHINKEEEKQLLFDKSLSVFDSNGAKEKNESNSKNNIPINKRKPRKKYSRSKKRKDEYSALKIPNLNFQQFNDFLCLKINGDKNKKVLKESLLLLYEQLKIHLKFLPLSRAEKRDKNKILIKLFEKSTDVIYCIERIPDIFLKPVLFNLKAKLERKNELKIQKRKRHAGILES